MGKSRLTVQRSSMAVGCAQAVAYRNGVPTRGTGAPSGPKTKVDGGSVQPECTPTRKPRQYECAARIVRRRGLPPHSSEADPGSGRYGRVLEAARRVGHEMYATDLVHRGYEHFDQALNLLLCGRRLGDNIICN